MYARQDICDCVCYVIGILGIKFIVCLYYLSFAYREGFFLA